MFKSVAIFYMRRQKSAVIMLILGKPYIYGHFSGLWGKPQECREIWGVGHSGEGSAKAKTIGSDSQDVRPPRPGKVYLAIMPTLISVWSTSCEGESFRWRYQKHT